MVVGTGTACVWDHVVEPLLCRPVDAVHLSIVNNSQYMALGGLTTPCHNLKHLAGRWTMVNHPSPVEVFERVATHVNARTGEPTRIYLAFDMDHMNVAHQTDLCRLLRAIVSLPLYRLVLPFVWLAMCQATLPLAFKATQLVVLNRGTSMTIPDQTVDQTWTALPCRKGLEGRICKTCMPMPRFHH